MFPTIRRLFSSRQVANTAPRSKRSRGFPARKSVKLMLEILEDRLAPTVNLSYSASLGTLTVAAANSTLAPATIEVGVGGGGQEWYRALGTRCPLVPPAYLRASHWHPSAPVPC